MTTPGPDDELKRKEAMRRYEELELLYRTAPVGLAMLDRELRHIRINDRLAALNGRTAAEHIGRTIHEMAPEIAPELEKHFRWIFETGQPVLNVELHRPASPDRDADTYSLGQYYPVKAADGRVEAISVVVVDITARKMAEVTLNATLAQLKGIFTAAPVGIGVAINRVIQEVNETMIQMLGYSREELVGHPAHKIYATQEEYERTGRAYQQLEDKRVASVETQLRHKGGRIVDVIITAVHLDVARREMGVVFTITDITERKQLAEQLRQSQKMEAIGQLSGAVAHDFNNLLTVINGHIGLLQMRGQVSPELTNSIQQIAEASNRAGNLTRQLLTFSRQEVMQQSDHNLNGLVANLLKMLRRLLGEHIELEVDYSPQSVPIRADEGMVEQVLLNLVVNARDAMPKGGVLRIATTAVDISEAEARGQPQIRPGRFACLMVCDTGHGIQPDILPRIFEPFFTTKELGKGTGLGLATVYGVMQQHEGWISVESQPGSGTTFRAFFPLLASPLPEAAIAQSTSIRGGHETILFVEDEEAVRTLGEAALTGLGYRVLCAATGVEALQVWQAHRHEIDLLVTDLVMPGGINGRELAERLLPDHPRMPVIYMSGYSHEVAGKDFLLQDGRNYLAKPFDVAKLAATVRSNLDRSESRKPFDSR